MPGAGHLRDRVRFEQRGADDNGEPGGPWEGRLSVWAGVKFLKGSEPVIQQRLQGVQPAGVVIRDSAQAREITTGWRLIGLTGVIKDKVFDITSATPGAPGFIDILAQAGPNAG